MSLAPDTPYWFEQTQRIPRSDTKRKIFLLWLVITRKPVGASVIFQFSGPLMLPRKLFDDSHETFRETVKRFVENEITPYYAQWEKDGIVSRDVMASRWRSGFIMYLGARGIRWPRGGILGMPQSSLRN